MPDLLRADFTDLNERLARHYGIPESYGTHFRRVTLPNPDRTSPVLRGKWLLDNIFGVYVPPPSATVGDRVIGGTDRAAQTHCVVDKIEGALPSLGASLADVVRTRVYVRHVEHWEPVARAHGERFGAVQSANTLVGAPLVGDDDLVETESEAEMHVICA